MQMLFQTPHESILYQTYFEDSETAGTGLTRKPRMKLGKQNKDFKIHPPKRSQ